MTYSVSWRPWAQAWLAACLVYAALWGHHQLAAWHEITLTLPPPPVGSGSDQVLTPPLLLPPPVRPPQEVDSPGEPEPALTRAPQLAIIIDDLGWNAEGTEAIMALPYPLTMAVLPAGLTTVRDAAAALAAGHEVFLHLPMEPLGGFGGRPRVVAGRMGDEELDRLVEGYLNQLPQAVGVNNHMGSKATSDRRVAQRVLNLVKQRQLVFVDSRTWHASVMCEVAQELEVPCLPNQAFLDNRKDIDYITQRLEYAAALARDQGQVVAIAHVHPVTAQALEHTLPRLLEAGIELVYVRQLLSPSSPAAGP